MPYFTSRHKKQQRKNDYKMNGSKLGSVHCVEDLGVTIASSLKLSQQCKHATGKANKILSFINKNISFKNKDVILLLYYLTQITSGICRAILVVSPCKGYGKTSCPAKGYADDYVLV